MATPHDAADAPAEEAPASGRPGLPIEPRRLWKAVRRGRWILLVAATLSVLVGVIVGKYVIRHRYESTATLRFEGLAALEEGAEADARRDLATQMEGLRHDPVLTEVRARLGLGVPLDVMRIVFSNTTDADTGIVTITGTGDDPDAAAEMANVVVEVFLGYQVEQRRTRITTAIVAADERIAAAREELAAARGRYNAFRTEHGITDLSSEQETALDNAGELRAEADLAQAEIASLEARVRQLREDLRRTPRTAVVSSSSESPDTAELARLEAYAQQLRGTLSPDHPRVLAAERQARALRDRIRSGGGTRIASSTMGASSAYDQIASALTTATADLEATRQRSEQLRILAEQAQRRVEGFSAIEGEAAGMLADVNVKEQLVTTLEAARARLQNLLENPQSGFRVLSPAAPPESAVPSRRKQQAAIGIPVAVVLLVLLALFTRELWGLRLYSPAEIAFWGNGPVVGATVWPRDPNAVSDLVADLDDFVPEARGSMLIVGITDKESALAGELAKQLTADWTESTVLDPQGGRSTDPDFSRRSLPSNASPSSYGPSLGAPNIGGGTTSAEFDAAPTQVHSGGAIELLGPPTIVSGSAPYGILHAVSAPSPEAAAERLSATAWDGGASGQQLRRAARLADRVLVVAPAGVVSVRHMLALGTRLGRTHGVGFIVVGMDDEHAALPDRAGPVEAFWAATKE